MPNRYEFYQTGDRQSLFSGILHAKRMRSLFAYKLKITSLILIIGVIIAGFKL